MNLPFIFSIKKEGVHKIITVCGIKIKIKDTGKEIQRLTKGYKRLVSYAEQMKMALDSCCDITKCPKAKGKLRKIQTVMSKALKIVIKILDENDIKYWLDFGTCLGAYRHKGFIPWDYDIDISMDRPNYIKAQKILPEKLKGLPFKLVIGEKGKPVFMKIAINSHLVIDIFPYDFANCNCSLDDAGNMWLKSRDDYNAKFPLKKFWKKKYKVEETYEDMFEMYKKAGLDDRQSKDYTFIFRGIDSSALNATINFHPYNEVYPLKKIQFEDFEAWAPKTPEQYLTRCDSGHYGDIMKFPPISAINVYNTDKLISDAKLQEVEEELNRYLGV